MSASSAIEADGWEHYEFLVSENGGWIEVWDADDCIATIPNGPVAQIKSYMVGRQDGLRQGEQLGRLRLAAELRTLIGAAADG